MKSNVFKFSYLIRGDDVILVHKGERQNFRKPKILLLRIDSRNLKGYHCPQTLCETHIDMARTSRYWKFPRVQSIQSIHPSNTIAQMSDIALADLFPLMQRYPDLMLSQVTHFIGLARRTSSSCSHQDCRKCNHPIR